MSADQGRGAAPRLRPRDSRGGRPTREVAAQLGGHILDTALHQFSTRGVDATTMDDIAAAANVSKRTLYARFGSKLALVEAVIDRGVSLHQTRIVSSIPAGPLRERLVFTTRKMLDVSLRPDVIGLADLIHWHTVNTPTPGGERGGSAVDRAIGLIEALIVESVGVGTVPDDELHFAATLIIDVAVTVPRDRILRRRDMENRVEVKAAYVERVIMLLFQGLPFIDQSMCNAASMRA